MRNLLHSSGLQNYERPRYFLLLFFFLSLSSASSFAQSGQTLNFDGIDDYVSLPFGISGDYTKEAWIYATSTTSTPNIISGSETALYISNGHLTGGHANGGYNQVIDPDAITINTWYHVAVTYTVATGDMKLYKNGALVSSAISVPAYTENLLEIGRFANGNYFFGNIDEVRIWSTVRTDAELEGSANCGLTGDEPGLVAYYKFNQGIAGGNNTLVNSIADSSDKCVSNNGTINNFALIGNSSNFISPGAPVSGTCNNMFSNIGVTGNLNCIFNGNTATSIADNTNFGAFAVSPITKTFVVNNSGNVDLNISGVTITGTNAGDFSVVSTPSLIQPGDSANLVLRFSPTGAKGIKNAIVTINNDDVDESTYTFNITGNFAGLGQTLSFDGFDDRIDLRFGLTGNYTKEAWILAKNLGGTPNIITGNSASGTALFIDNGHLAAGHGPAFTQLQDLAVLNTDIWYHVAVTYNATSQTMTLYKNGISVGSASVSGYTETLLQIGAFENTKNFDGNIDEVRIWNVERTPAEIAANVNCPLSGSEPGLIAYYNFNQGAAGADNSTVTQLNDLHGNCPQNGQLQNFALTGTTSNWIAPGAPFSGGFCTTQVPNISVAGNNSCIVIDDPSPTTMDNTDFGTTHAGTPVNDTFYIRNNGGADLSVSTVTLAGTDAASFNVVNFTPVTLVAGDSVALVVSFAPSTSGIKNATVIVNNNDADEGAYNFAVTGTALAPLPVTLLYFKANAAGKVVSLNWETSTELNNAGFELQRSTDNNASWQKIGYVAATNRANGSRYTYTDAAPFKGINAYRLKQIDLNGRSAISRVELVNLSGDINSISLYPNPVQDKISIVTNDSKLLNSQAKISTASGAIIRTILITNLRQEVNLSYLSKGIYFIRFNNGTVQRIVKL